MMRFILAIAALFLLVPAAWSDGTEETQEAVKLYRGTSIIAASDPNHATYRPDFTHDACLALKEQRWKAEAATKTSGSKVTYRCQLEERSIITFHRPPTCGDRPGPDNQRQQTCPAGTVGTWLQDQVYTLQPYPDCWVLGEWTPAQPLDGMCAAEPPLEPELLPAPTNARAAGISTSSIRVTWDPVASAGAYSLERCIGSACTGFSELVCVTGPAGTHSSLPANLTARYRVRASRDAACTSDAGRSPTEPLNLGEYSAIVSGTTLGASPINCAVSAWSSWTAGTWSVCAGGQQSRTETRTRTVSTQPANGGTACPALTETRTVSQACTPGGTASLQWTPPTRNTNGSSLTNLAGYSIHYGLSAEELVQTVQLANPGLSTYTISGLSPGTYYFAVRAYTSGGAESVNSNIVSRVIN